MRRLAIAVFALGALASCRAVLGLGDPELLDPEGSIAETPAVTEDAAACDFANLVTDAKNCGRCGHDCRGGRCERGRCSPLVMTTADSEVFAAKNGQVYAIEDGVILRAQSATERFQLAKVAVGRPRSLIASTTHLVWSGDETGVRVCSLGGCASDDPIRLSVAGKNTGALVEVPALNQLYPYLWANDSDGTVEVARDPGAPEVLSTTRLVDGPCRPRFAPIASGAILHDSAAGRFVVYPAGEAAGRDAGAAEESCAVASNRQDVFYTDTDTIWRSAVNPDGTLAPRVPFREGVVAPRVLAADDEHVYWAASTPETDLVRCAIAEGCTTTELVVEGMPAIANLQLDDAFVYFAVLLNPTLGHVIYRVPK